MLATTLVEQPSPSLDGNAPAAAAVASLDAPRMVSIEDRMALTHAVRQEAQAHQTRYQDRYDGKQIGKSCKLELGDAVLLRHTAPDRAAITTSKLLGFANTGPYILAEFVGKTSARLRDALWASQRRLPRPYPNPSKATPQHPRATKILKSILQTLGFWSWKKGREEREKKIATIRRNDIDCSELLESGDSDLPRVAVVGGGLAGLACAKVTLVEAGREVGGRASCLEPWSGRYSFDHGSQYLSPKSEEFSAFLEQAEAAGAAAPWGCSQVGSVEAGDDGAFVQSTFQAFPAEKPMIVGTPNMAAIGQYLLTQSEEHMEVATNTACMALQGKSGGGAARWELELRVREGGHFWYRLLDCDFVVIATPAPAAAKLVRPVAPGMAAAASSVNSTVCWCLTVAFADSLELPFQGASVEGPQHSGIAWAANNSSKPGRPEGAECWVVQASPDWSSERAALKAKDVEQELLENFQKFAGVRDAPVAHIKAFKAQAQFRGDGSDPLEGHVERERATWREKEPRGERERELLFDLLLLSQAALSGEEASPARPDVPNDIQNRIPHRNTHTLCAS
ncbi:hypothetical protein CYMTET_50346 [Cymbomonas tetramitiformis]|uniref:Amine oxidase domain-containing protein n=1 Tax=Cymbomonas tetramitiformis TaxID=36881 RepID=A0AAE0BND1_9CHLO|nr:hypothetical protein CYMTET_50346 [Cymbomonas tetramitiformis]